jgi:hypothetical protein
MGNRGTRPTQAFRLTTRLDGIRLEADGLVEEMIQQAAEAAKLIHANPYEVRVILAEIRANGEAARRLLLEMTKGAPPPEDREDV